jgi:predicted ABC-type sugar transport system permease subunit
LASYVFTRDVNPTWRLLDMPEALLIGLNTGELKGPLVAGKRAELTSIQKVSGRNAI